MQLLAGLQAVHHLQDEVLHLEITSALRIKTLPLKSVLAEDMIAAFSSPISSRRPSSGTSTA